MFHALVLLCMGTVLFGIDLVRNELFPVLGGIVIGIGVLMLVMVLRVYWERYLRRGRRD